MINAAAMLGLGNDPAMKELQGIKAGIQTLFQLKTKDYAEMQRESKREREMDKREAQDVERILNTETKELARLKDALKTSQGGLMAALLGGTALLGAAGIMGGFNLVEFVVDLKDNLLGLLGLGTAAPSQPTLEEGPGERQAPPAGSDADTDLGDVSDLQPADPNFKGLPMPNTVKITSRPGPRGAKLHGGLDIGGVGGEKLTVSRPSIVVENRTYSGYGNTVIFKDNRGEQLYAHMRGLSKFKKGQTVQPGQIIGILGNTGRSSGPHLHWEYSPTLGLVGRPDRSRDQIKDPSKSAGMNWKTPFTGKQTGGKVGIGRNVPSSAVAATALPIIKHHEALSSITPGVNDYIFNGGNSVKSKTPWAKVNKPTTPIHAYPDGGGVPTIGWGSIYNDSMMKGSSKVKMGDTWSKSKADDKLKKDTLELLRYLRSKHAGFNHMTLKQQAGFLSQHYNTGAYTATDSSKYPVFKKLFREGKVHEAAKAHPRSGGAQFASRIADEQKYMMAGPATVPPSQKKQAGGRVGGAQKFQKGGNVHKTGKQSDLMGNYDGDFFQRKAKSVARQSIIIVNKIVRPRRGGGGAMAKNSDVAGHQGTSMSYSDIAQHYYRYVGGIKA